MTDTNDPTMDRSGQSYITTIRVNDHEENKSNHNGMTDVNTAQKHAEKPLCNGTTAPPMNGTPARVVDSNQVELNTPSDGERISPSVVVLPPLSPRSVVGQPGVDMAASSRTRAAGGDSRRTSKKKFCSFLLAFGFLASLVCLISLALLYHDASLNRSPETERRKILDAISFTIIPERSKQKTSLQTNVTETSQYYLLIKDDVITWGSPTSRVTITWFRGDSVEVHIIRNNGEYTTKLLGDPITNEDATYQMNIQPSDRVALRLSRGKTHALLGDWFTPGTIFKWTKFSKDALVKEFPKHKELIEKLGM